MEAGEDLFDKEEDDAHSNFTVDAAEVEIVYLMPKGGMPGNWKGWIFSNWVMAIGATSDSTLESV